MKYQIQPGVVLQPVCDEYLLIATGGAVGKCPQVRRINAGAAFYWEKLQSGMDSEDLAPAAATEFGIDIELIRPGLRKFLDALETQNYIISSDQ